MGVFDGLVQGFASCNVNSVFKLFEMVWLVMASVSRTTPV